MRVEGIDDADFGRMHAPWVDDATGLEFDLLSPDRVEAHVEAGPQHHQPYGIVHGGVYASIVETLASMGAAARSLSYGKVCVGVSNTTDFIKAHRTGRLDAVATPVQSGRHQQLWQVEIHDTDGQLIARGQVRLQNLDPAEVGMSSPTGDGG